MATDYVVGALLRNVAAKRMMGSDEPILRHKAGHDMVEGYVVMARVA